jgi:hypothetical protein
MSCAGIRESCHPVHQYACEFQLHQLSNPLQNLREIQYFLGLQAAHLKTQSSSSFDPLVPLQILLSVYWLNEEASNFVKQTLPNLINTYGSIYNPTWMNISIKIVDGRQNHSLVTHLNNKCRSLKRLVHIAEQNVFAMHTCVRMPKLGPDHHIYPWTEESKESLHCHTKKFVSRNSQIN